MSKIDFDVIIDDADICRILTYGRAFGYDTCVVVVVMLVLAANGQLTAVACSLDIDTDAYADQNKMFALAAFLLSTIVVVVRLYILLKKQIFEFYEYFCTD